MSAASDGRWRPLGPRTAWAVRCGLLIIAAASVALFASGGVILLSAGPGQQRLAEWGILAGPGDLAGDRLGGAISAEAQAAGVREGQRVVAVNGRATPNLELRSLGALPAGAPLTLTLRDEGGADRTVRLTRSYAHSSEAFGGWLSAGQANLIERVPALLMAAISLFAGLILIRRRASDPLAMLFAFQALVFIGASAEGYTAADASGLTPLVRLFDGLANAAAASLVFVFPDGTGRSWWRRIMIAAVVVWCAVSTGLNLAHLRYPDAMELLLHYSPFVFLAAGVAAMWLRYRRMTDAAQRQQLKPAMFGLMAGGVLVVGVAVLFRIAGEATDARVSTPAMLTGGMLSSISSAATSLGFLVALLRYRLYDTDTAIRRSVSWGVLTVAMLALFTVVEKIVEALGQAYFGGAVGTVGSGVAAALVALTFVPLHRRLTAWSERRFQRNLVELRDRLPAAVDDLRETAGPAELASEALARVRAGVRAVRGAVTAGGEVLAIQAAEPAGALAGDPALFPERLPLPGRNGADQAWLLLGPRPDGTLYSSEERAVLRQVADPLGRALSITLTRARNETERRAEFAALAQRLVRLEASVSPLVPAPAPDTDPPA